ncbi:MAG: efflux RND transporter permease subunit, partial [Verrucomicrobia bacterium]|nr:efflux RND transporter permease subunit [Verrucomicrobiota bacterium]
MLNAIIRQSLANRFLVVFLSGVLLLGGIYTGGQLPVEVLPDLTKPTVTIIAECPGLAPEEVEALVTVPVESTLMGVSGLTRLRSISDVALSLSYVEFEWGTDILQARRLVQERLQMIQNDLPEAVTPIMTPVASLMGGDHACWSEQSPWEPGPSRVKVDGRLDDTPPLSKYPGCCGGVVSGRWG